MSPSHILHCNRLLGENIADQGYILSLTGSYPFVVCDVNVIYFRIKKKADVSAIIKCMLLLTLIATSQRKQIIIQKTGF